MTCEQASALMGVALFFLHAPHRLFLALLDPPWLVDGHHDTFCTFVLFSVYFSYFNGFAFLSYIRSLLTLVVHFVLLLALLACWRSVKSNGMGEATPALCLFIYTLFLYTMLPRGTLYRIVGMNIITFQQIVAHHSVNFIVTRTILMKKKGPK